MVLRVTTHFAMRITTVAWEYTVIVISLTVDIAWKTDIVGAFFIVLCNHIFHINEYIVYSRSQFSDLVEQANTFFSILSVCPMFSDFFHSGSLVAYLMISI